MKIAAILFLLVAAAAASKSTIDWSKVEHMELDAPTHILNFLRHPVGPRIVGGVEAVPNSLPYQVGLIIQMGDKQAFCGGSLISDQWVLTAAHCAEPGTNFMVILGAHKVQEEEDTQVRINTTEKYVHPEWNRLRLINDVALLKLPERVELNDNINTVALAYDSSDDFADQESIASGWGKDSDSAAGISPVLRYVKTAVMTNKECNDYWFGIIGAGHLCTSGKAGKGTCNGDSGGPLVVEGVDGQRTQIGVVSFGMSLSCKLPWPRGFSRVTAYTDWIQSTSNIVIGK